MKHCVKLLLCVLYVGLVSPFKVPSLAAQDTSGNEVQYNGIVLPKEWPPQDVSFDDIKARKPIAEPPYLKTPPAVIPIDVGRQLFVDDFLIEKTDLKREHHLAEYHPDNPVFKGGMVFSGGVWFDPKDDLFKMWYFGKGTNYTTSKDGIHWEKGKNVLPGNTDSQTVWLDLEAKDPAQRFKMIRSIIAKNDCKGEIYYSPDGQDWNHVGQTGSWGDRSTFFLNPFRNVWVISIRHGWGQPRARRYWEVKDLAKGPYWGQPGQPKYAPFWVGSDKLDPMRTDYKIPCELYNLDCVGYESLLIGLFTIWRGQPGPRQKPNEVCIGYSRDGFHWSRPDRRPFCPVSETPGAWNYANVQSAGGCCLVVGDKLYFYVSGRGNGNVTGLATIRRDGFTSMDAGAEAGTLTTRKLTFKGKHLFVNLDAPKGTLKVEALDDAGKVLLTSQPVKGDKTLLKVEWKNGKDLSTLVGKTVRFRFHLQDGKLYSFWVSPSASGASHGYVAAGGPGFTGIRDTIGEK